jgi:hypothetical protein
MPIVIDGGATAFKTLAFGMPHQGTLNFLEHRLQRTSEYLNEAGREFMSRGLEIFNEYAGSEAMRKAKAAIRSVQHMFDPNVIMPLHDIGAIQQAPISMQRWIMAEPTVRSLFHQNRCDGYSDTYVDMHPGRIGKDHEDWRAVMNGRVVETPESEEYEWESTNYFDVREDDVQLQLVDQNMIIDVWDKLRVLVTSGKEDPTSPRCDSL